MKCCRLYNEGSITYITFGDGGKCYRLDVVLSRARREAKQREVRRDTTFKRTLEKVRTVSRDMPNSTAAKVAISDGGKWVALLDAWLDGVFGGAGISRIGRCIVARRNCVKIAHALTKERQRRTDIRCAKRGKPPKLVDHYDWREVANLVVAVIKNGTEGREKSLRELGYCEKTYLRHILKYLKILGYEGGC